MSKHRSTWLNVGKKVKALEARLKEASQWSALWKAKAKIWRKLSRGLDKNATHHADKAREFNNKLTEIKRAAHAAEETAQMMAGGAAYNVEANKWADLMIACGTWIEIDK